MKSEIYKSCSGCKLKHPDGYYKCVIDECEFFSDITKECPCSICLIKGICKVFCVPFLNYVHDNLCKSLGVEGIEQKYEPLRKMQTSRIDLLMFLQYHIDHIGKSYYPYKIITVNSEIVR